MTLYLNLIRLSNSRSRWKVFILSLFGLFVFPLLLLSLLSVLHLSPFYINKTDSAPHGVYLRVPGTIEYGDYAIIPLPQRITTPTDTTEKGTLILKKAYAFEGDSYTVTTDALSLTVALPNIHNTEFSRAEVKTFPISNASYLPHMLPGTYTVPANYILFLNDSDVSLDSRYLGPIPQNTVHCKVILLINFNAIFDFLYLHLPASWVTPME